MSPNPSRFVCLHGHFYQPPRENPWLEAIEAQDSAAPFHDWNERVTAECYAPNTVARVLDEDGRVVALRNNYRDISFNFGPTLLSWMESARPDVYAAIRTADRESQRRYGHGNAIAQVYGHCIMPLAARHDQVTQVRWGIADFQHRFGRRPAGMWLPETAVDLTSLRALAENGIAFTILAPTQAARTRHGDGPWHSVAAGGIDPSRPYSCYLGNGLSITLFFYDGGLAHSVAFAGLLNDGREFAQRLTAAAEARPGTPLVHIATDGESYGHHHRFGEMALAAALDRIEREKHVQLTNYAAYLDRVQVVDSVEIIEHSSWSCAHGVERWRAHCGCNASHPHWQQTWRQPLREALDWLKQEVDVLFEREGTNWFTDPWAARDAYVQVLLQRDAEHRDAFLQQQVRRPVQTAERPRVWTLLEMQRHALLSFTSCGWFFDEPSGLETVQVLTYAARAVQLAAELGSNLEPDLLRRLAPLRSNLPDYADGIDLYNQLVRPLVSDGRRVVAHYAMNALFETPPPETRSYAYRIANTERVVEEAGMLALAVGRVHLLSEMTEDERDFDYVALHLGGQDMQCAVAAAQAGDTRDAAQVLLQTFRTAPLTELIRHIDVRFAGGVFTLRDVFLAERRRILDRVTGAARGDAIAAYERIVSDNRRLIEFLAHSGGLIPHELRVAGGFVLQRRFNATVERVVAGLATQAEASALLGEAQRWGVSIDRSAAAQVLAAVLATAVADLMHGSSATGLAACHGWLDTAAILTTAVDVTAAQNAFYLLWRKAPRAWPEALMPELQRLGERLQFRLPPAPQDARAA